MILYLDTSSLVKLYLDEEHSDLVHAWVERAEVVFTSRVALAEGIAAFAKRWRMQHLADADFESVKRALTDDWPGFSSVGVNEVTAAELAARLALRGFDAIHLAAAIEVFGQSGAAPTFFSSFDRQLNQAARAEGLAVLDGDSDAYPVAVDSSMEVHEPVAPYKA